MGTDHRNAGILPASICRQDGGAPRMAALLLCSTYLCNGLLSIE